MPLNKKVCAFYRGWGVRVIKSEKGMRRAMSNWHWIGRSGAAAILLSSMLAAPVMAQPVYEAIVLDAQTGQVLRELNPDVSTQPASLTKMMTLYLTFEALNQGRLRLDQYLRVSDYAATRAPSKLGLVPGESVTVHDVILGIVTKSANDAAVVLAEALGGSEGAFAQQMTWKARQLGMNSTVYYNANGLPDPNQRTTARDIARLALALYHQFPREYRYFSTRPVMASVQPSASSHSAQPQAPVYATSPSAAPAAATAAPQQSNPAPVMASAPPQGDTATVAGRSGMIDNALRHLSPVGRAEAATAARETAGEDWSIQLGAFRAESAAEQAIRHATSVTAVRGKPREVLAPAKGESNRLYRALLTHFSQKGAQAACGELHKKGIACTVVRPGALRVASQ